MTKTPLQRNVERSFPALTTAGYLITSPSDRRYNCIAWAAGDDGNWWEPVQMLTSAPLGGYYWPQGIPLEYTLASYQRAFERQGYRVCQSSEMEDGYEKAAIFVDAAGTPTHAARQTDDGSWVSKLGQGPDIVHEELDGVEGVEYGRIRVILRRRIVENRPNPVVPY